MKVLYAKTLTLLMIKTVYRIKKTTPPCNKTRVNQVPY